MHLPNNKNTSSSKRLTKFGFTTDYECRYDLAQDTHTLLCVLFTSHSFLCFMHLSAKWKFYAILEKISIDKWLWKNRSETAKDWMRGELYTEKRTSILLTLCVECAARVRNPHQRCTVIKFTIFALMINIFFGGSRAQRSLRSFGTKIVQNQNTRISHAQNVY